MADQTFTPDEEWRAIPGHDGYEASSFGRVRSLYRVLSDGRRWKGRILKQKTNRHGYLVVAIPIGGGRYRHANVNTLVAEAFFGTRPTRHHQSAHYDGDRKNNYADNLRWATAAENAADRDRHGTTAHLKGETHGMAKLTDEVVIRMRRMKASGVSVDELAGRFDVSRSTVFDALSGRTWGHI